MSESQEKSDDLIAELAKLMASNAQGGEPEAKPALKMQPLNEATAASPAPLRIPGMPNPAPAAAPAVAAPAAPVPAPAAAAPAPEVPKPAAAPTIRIPGMSQPVAAAAAEPTIVPPAPSAVAAPQAESKPALGGQFDFGRPPGVAPVIAPEPLNNWQSREVPKPALQPAPQPAPNASEPVLSVPLRSAPVAPAPAVEPRPVPTAPAAEAKPAPSFRPVPMGHAEPGVTPAPLAAAPAPVVSAPSMPANAPAGDGFDFDFGFGNEPPASSGGDGDKPVHDPIADLIAAELDAPMREDEPPAAAPAPVAAPKPAPIQPAPTQAAPVQAAPVRSFSNPGQAPVLVAKPTGSRPAPPPAPRPALQAQPQRAEADRFAVAPVFGLPGRSAPAPAPRAEPDPMDEIESLIGEAVRVELSPPERTPTVTLAPPPPPAVPVVPPLNTGFAPRRTELKDREPTMRSAEDAILAAAAATGARVDHVNHLDAEDRRPVKRMKVKPPKSRGFSNGARQYIGMAVAGTLLLAAGLGLYWVLGMGRTDPATAPVLTAEAGSAKQPAPVVASSETAAPAATGLFNQIEGRTTPEPNETLVSRDETEGAAPTEVARVVGAEPEDTEGGLANRKVRTVTVRPDGTIVPGDEAVAGNEVLPVARPTVPEIPGAEAQPSELLASVETPEVQPDAIAAAIAGETPVTAVVDPNAVTALVSAAPEPTAAASLPATIDPTRVAPAPMPRPSDRSTMVGGANRAVDLTAAIEETPATPSAAAPAPTASSGGPSGPYVQIAAQRSEAEAQASLRTAQSRFGSLWGNAQPYIQRADLGQKGIYYRVRVPASSVDEASSICSTIKANGGDCMASGG